LDEAGPDFKAFAPSLFKHMFEDQQVRVVLSRNLPPAMQDEVQGILKWASKNRRTPFTSGARATPTKLSACRQCGNRT
jgi:hypothetical protein